MRKISSAEIAQVLQDGARALVSVTVERDAALQKIAMLEQQRDVEKLASAMHEKGIELDKSYEDLSAHLDKEASAGHLPDIQRAVEMLTPNMGIKTASLTSDEGQTGGMHPFEQFILEGRHGEVG